MEECNNCNEDSLDPTSTSSVSEVIPVDVDHQVTSDSTAVADCPLTTFTDVDRLRTEVSNREVFSKDSVMEEDNQAGHVLAGDGLVTSEPFTSGNFELNQQICQTINQNSSEQQGGQQMCVQLDQQLNQQGDKQRDESMDARAHQPTNSEPLLIVQSGKTFQSSAEHFLRACKWSPDGSHLLINSEKSGIQVHNMESLNYPSPQDTEAAQLNGGLEIKVGEMVYDMDWYPFMLGGDPVTCCFVTTSRAQPVHLWDSQTGLLRGSYRAFDHLDELSTAYCVKFDMEGQKIYCGFKQLVRIFDVCVPGRDCISRSTYKSIGQRGIISCIAVNKAQHSIYAAGSYGKSVGVYSERDGELLSLLEGHRGGVTHLMFSHDGSKLFSGARMDNEILCWDMRNTARILFSLQRSVHTNQRMYFDIDRFDRYVVSGNHDGTVSVWDLTVTQSSSSSSSSSTHQCSSTCPVKCPSRSGRSVLGEDPITGEMILDKCYNFKAHGDTVNSISCHPTDDLLVTGSGRRHFQVRCVVDSDSESDDDDSSNQTYDNSVKVWNMEDVFSV